jgi:hypothetical protein
MGRTILLFAASLIAVVHFSVDRVHGEEQIELWDGKEWVEREVRTVEDLRAFTPAQDIPLSKYGARLDMRVRATGFFRTEKVDGRWWLVDPDGHLFITVGLCSVNQSHFSKEMLKKHFGTKEKWAEATVTMLKSHGFNSLGCWSDWEHINEGRPQMPYFTQWNFMLTYKKQRDPKYGRKGFQNQCMPVFDPGFETYCDEHAQRLSAIRDDPWLVGHFSDNELPFRPDSLSKFLALPTTDESHKAARKWWDVRRRQLGKSEDDIDTHDQEAFIAYLADRYYSVVNAAIKRYDSNHLYFGSRLHGRNINLPVFRGTASVDVVSVNYYYSGPREQEQMRQWLDVSGKPFINSEWYAMTVEPERVREVRGAGYRVKTARERGLFYQNRVLGFLASPGCVGWHWFKYGGDEDISHRGVVNRDYQPCRPLTDVMKVVNRQVYPLADYFLRKKDS